MDREVYPGAESSQFPLNCTNLVATCGAAIFRILGPDQVRLVSNFTPATARRPNDASIHLRRARPPFGSDMRASAQHPWPASAIDRSILAHKERMKWPGVYRPYLALARSLPERWRPRLLIQVSSARVESLPPSSGSAPPHVARQEGSARGVQLVELGKVVVVVCAAALVGHITDRRVARDGKANEPQARL